jgi:hypothetical protein
MANLPHITRFGLPGIDRSLWGCTPAILIANATSSSQRDIGAWLRHYNEVWPHSSLGYLAPAEVHRQEFAASVQATGGDAAVHPAFASRPVAPYQREAA